nr:MAG TPA: hypothetical protein [Caudoviricetes sp.]
MYGRNQPILNILYRKICIFTSAFLCSLKYSILHIS